MGLLGESFQIRRWLYNPIWAIKKFLVRIYRYRSGKCRFNLHFWPNMSFLLNKKKSNWTEALKIDRSSKWSILMWSITRMSSHTKNKNETNEHWQWNYKSIFSQCKINIIHCRSWEFFSFYFYCPGQNNLRTYFWHS